MQRVGVTGGIGSGKSTVARLLDARGADVIDADRIAREVVAPGRPALDEIVARWGPGLLLPDGSLDRAAMAAIVFTNDEELRALESLTHPHIAAAIRDEYDRLAEVEDDLGVERVVVLDHPLLVESGMHASQDVVVVVVVDAETRVARLVERGLDADDARARMANQATDDRRRAVADHVVDNNGDLDDLERRVDELWSALRAAAP